jgi:hypothetical protein
MKDASPYLARTGSAMALALCMTTQALALETDIYLDASASASVQQVDTSLQLQSEASSGASRRDDVRLLENAGTQESGNATYERSAGSSSWNRLWAYFGVDENTSPAIAARTSFWEELIDSLNRRIDANMHATSSTSATTSVAVEETLANVRVEEVSAKRATITWSPSVFQNLKVYYSTTTPVVAADATAVVSPWKFWKRSEVTLRRLIPNTTYFYKVVAETNSGIITTTEASFRTMEK